jgi:hypothetical protein
VSRAKGCESIGERQSSGFEVLLELGFLSVLGVNPRFGFRDLAIPVAVASFDGRVKSGVWASDNMCFMFEHDGDVDFGFAFATSGFGAVLAQSLVEDPGSGIVFELDLGSRFIAIDGFFVRDTPGPETLAEGDKDDDGGFPFHRDHEWRQS